MLRSEIIFFLAFLFALMQKETKKSRQTPLLRRLCHPPPPFLFCLRPVVFRLGMIEAICKTPLLVMVGNEKCCVPP